MTHDEYHEHVQKHLNESLPNNSELNTFLQNHKDISTIILNLNLDSAEAILKPLYCPIERRKPRDPQVMLRSLILMSLLKMGSISDWVEKTRSQKLWAILAGEKCYDFPLHVTMPGGNESDFTLSLNTLDRFQKAADENGLDIHIHYFCGDGHHDSYGHYQYLNEKNIIPVIPLTHQGKKTYPQFKNIDVPLDTDGTPLCPGGKRMRHHSYDKKKHVHVYACPVKRHTHRNGKSLYITHSDECPKDGICCPQSSLAPLVYIKSDTDSRYFPPLDRNSDKFTEISHQRSATERLNSVIDSYDIDHRHRNADYVLIRLALITIAIHGVIRNAEAVKNSSQDRLFDETMEKVGVTVPRRADKAA